MASCSAYSCTVLSPVFFLGVAPHELGHGTVFRTKWLNKVFLYVFSLLSWWDPFDYASSHTYHHRYTQYPEGDRENVMPMEPNLRPFLLLQLFTINLFGRPGRNFGKGGLLWSIWVTWLSAQGKVAPKDALITEWLTALHADQPAEHARSIGWSRLLLLFHGTILVVSILTGQWGGAAAIECCAVYGQLGTLFRRPDAAPRPAQRCA